MQLPISISRTLSFAYWCFLDQVRRGAISLSLGFVVICTWMAARHNSPTYAILLGKVPLALAASLVPVLLCAGLVYNDIDSGRAMVLVSCGLRRTELLLGRVTGHLVLLLSVVVLPVSIALLANNNLDSDSRAVPWLIMLTLAIGIVYQTTLAAFLSTVLRGSANTTAQILSSSLFAASYLRYTYVYRFSDPPHQQLMRSAKLILMSPYPAASKVAQQGKLDFTDLGVICSATAAFLLLGVLRMRVVELGNTAAEVD